MNKRELSKNLILYFSLLMIVPTSLYINFFIFKLTTWSYEIKAWLIFSLLIIISEITTLIVVRYLLKIIILKYELIDKKLSRKFIHITSIAFLFGNVFLSLAIYRLKMWYYLPIFQGLTILLLGMSTINKNLTKKNKLSFIKRISTIEKIEYKLNKQYILLFIAIVIYVSLSITIFYFIQKNYNPLNKSLEYYMEGTGFKPRF